METLIKFIPEILSQAIMAVITSLSHNWIPLGFAILTAAVLKAHVDTEKIKETILRKTNISILGSVALGAFTPFCSCGTMALVIGMLTTTLPWGPIMAFLTSSPLMSPDGFILITGIISLKFAIALTIASIVIGLGSGYLTHFIESKTDFLKNQTRFSGKKPDQSCGCSGAAAASEPNDYNAPSGDDINCAGCDSCETETENTTQNYLSRLFQKIKLPEIITGIIDLGLKQIIPNFALFVAIGFLVNYFVPTSWIMALFSAGNIFAVPLAALIGLPLYLNGESALPLIKALMAGGAGGGAMLAFLVTGPGTSAWVIAGIATFMKKRIICLYVGYLLAGGIILGYLYDLLLAMGM